MHSSTMYSYKQLPIHSSLDVNIFNEEIAAIYHHITNITYDILWHTTYVPAHGSGFTIVFTEEEEIVKKQKQNQDRNTKRDTITKTVLSCSAVSLFVYNQYNIIMNVTLVLPRIILFTKDENYDFVNQIESNQLILVDRCILQWKGCRRWLVLLVV